VVENIQKVRFKNVEKIENVQKVKNQKFHRML
jgi:hypothetical protein